MNSNQNLIENILSKELDIISEEKRKLVAKKICDAINDGLQENNEPNNEPMSNEVVYDLIFSLKEIELVEKYNGTVRGLWFDPWYISVLKKYVSLLPNDSWNTKEISEPIYIQNIFNKNKGNENCKYVLMMKEPIKSIQRAINYVCDAVPIFQTYK